MATTKFNKAKIRKNILKRLNEFKKTELPKVAKIVRNQIVEDARNGVGWDGKDFPDIKLSTIHRRIDLAEVNKTHGRYSPGFSNATFTGQTIASIKAIVTGGKIKIRATGKHSKIKGLRGKPIKGSDKKNSKIISELKDRGWKILGVSEKAKSRVINQFKKFLRQRKK